MQTTANQNGVNIAALSTALAAAQADIIQILADLALVSTAEQLDQVSAALAAVQTDVTEILNGTSSINQPISLTNANDVAFANGIIYTQQERSEVSAN